MIRKQWVCLLLTVLVLCLFFPVSAEEIPAANTWICTVCGAENSGGECPRCSCVRDAWICFGCDEKNLTGTCRSCGLAKEESLRQQASCGNPLKVFPAVRYLAREGDPDALCELAEFY